MIVPDTNVVSEVMKAAPAPQVLDRLNEHETFDPFVTAVTIAGIESGLRTLPPGRRRESMRERFERPVSGGFARRVLAFDEAAARDHGDLMGVRRAIGRPTSVPDGRVAAIARVRGFAVATRSVGDFEYCGVELANPFAPGPT